MAFGGSKGELVAAIVYVMNRLDGDKLESNVM